VSVVVPESADKACPELVATWIGKSWQTFLPVLAKPKGKQIAKCDKKKKKLCVSHDNKCGSIFHLIYGKYEGH